MPRHFALSAVLGVFVLWNNLGVADEDVMFPAELRYATVRSFLDQLRSAGNRLADIPEATAQLLRQAESVLTDVETAINGAGAPADEAERLSADIGVSRASRGVHPTESAQAAVTMYHALLPV